jgi:hypothetical protein
MTMTAHFKDQTSQACLGQNVCIFETTRGTTYDCVMPLSKGGTLSKGQHVIVWVECYSVDQTLKGKPKNKKKEEKRPKETLQESPSLSSNG